MCCNLGGAEQFLLYSLLQWAMVIFYQDVLPICDLMKPLQSILLIVVLSLSEHTEFLLLSLILRQRIQACLELKQPLIQILMHHNKLLKAF